MILPLSPANKVTNEVMSFSFAIVLSALFVGTKKRNFSVSLICISFFFFFTFQYLLFYKIKCIHFILRKQFYR